MPQMAPLNWLLLMMVFIIIMISFNLLNYYSFSYPTYKPSQSKAKKTSINWKW
uniref:ATP synthase F0 subunit 8 n=1 Tax=Tribolium freemani TaxID=7072 RepID=UPI002079F340|nr:ATP synthase F0 subunit 8 [Tribolium freemani]URX54542.1 ATP synthase F0 subunit 8 [Tribolium freemani]